VLRHLLGQQDPTAVHVSAEPSFPHDGVQILTATSAIPWSTPVEMEGESFFDGGLGDNVPVRPLYERGYRNFIVVYLAQRDYVDKSAFPGAHFVEIVPSVSLGDFFSGR
jgi:NTE family protein